ncbi:MAG: hypothetical protein ACM3SQ_07930 [Betaproteobacteria bacterium]
MRRLLQTALILGAVGIAATLDAQPQRGMGMGPRYDKSKEVTVTGTVESVDEHQGMGMMGTGMMGTGTHLQLTAGNEKLDVHVGPTRWLTDHKYTFAKGDEITVTGSRMKINDTEALIAREIDKAGTKITLRDENGRPLWAGGPRG